MRARGAAIAGALAVAVSYACAPAATSWRQRPDFNTISREDLLSTHYLNAYDAVQALRSNWLLSRPGSSLPQNQVLVYLDNIRLGGTSELRGVPVQQIEYVRHFDATDATIRWGIDHAQGVIYISTHPVGSAASPGI